MNKKLKCAIIGYGGMGAWHAAQIQKLKFLQVVGAYDIKPERNAFAESNGIHAYGSLKQLLADPEIELVVVATPNDVHKSLVIAALAAGKHVVCEKPVALNCKELEEMIAASKKYKRLFTVHQNRRWDSDFQTVEKILKANTLGPVFNIESRVHGSRGVPGDWRNKKRHGGGMVLDWGIHLLDQALMMTLPRKITSVFAQLTHVTNTDCDDGFRVTLQFNDGLNVYIETGTSNFINLPRWYILGENGSAIIHDWYCKGEIVKVSDWENRDAVPIQAGAGLTKTMAPRTDDTIKHYPLPPVKWADWIDFYKNVVAHIRNNAPIIVTHDQQRRLMKLVETVFASAKANKVIRTKL